MGERWGKTRVTNVMLKLDDETSGSKGDIAEERSIPHLMYVSINGT